MNKEKNTGGPAFPNEGFNGWGEPQEGMTLRDYFAAKAMQSILNMSVKQIDALYPEAKGKVSIAAYLQADAMLEAREA